MRTHRSFFVFSATLLLAALVMTPAPAARATFPGSNGKLVFAGGASCQPYVSGSCDIFTVKPDGTALTKILHNGFGNVDPTWSPDGKTIAFVSDMRDRYARSDLYTMNPDGSGIVRVVGDGMDYSPAWSPDGSKIAFESARTGFPDIWTKDLSTGTLTDLTNTSKALEAGPAWSPDGTKIAFISNRPDPENGSWDIWMTDVNTLVTTQVTMTGRVDLESFPSWSPDGASVAYGFGYDIWSTNVTTGVATQITTGKPADIEPVWSPDGTKIAFSSTNRSGTRRYNIWAKNQETGINAQLTASSSRSYHQPDWRSVSP